MFGLFSSSSQKKSRPTVTFLGRETKCFTSTMLEHSILAAITNLRDRGIQQGSRVGLVMETSPAVLISFFALLGLRATIVPVRGSYAVASPRRRARSLTPALRVGQIDHLLMPSGDAEGWKEAARREKASIALLEAPSDTSADPGAASWREPDSQSIALLQFSSGSTSEPKGIEISLGSLVSNVAGVAERVGITSTDRFVSWLPLSHDMGLSSLLCMMRKGVDIFMMSPVAFVQNPLDWLTEIARQRATLSVAPQFAIRMCLRQLACHEPEFPGDLSSLRYLMNGGEAIHPPSCRAFEERLAHVGLRKNLIQPAYGLAENTCAVSVRPPLTPWKEIPASRSSLEMGSKIERLESSKDAVLLVGNGSAIRGTEVAAFSTSGEPLPEGIVGELFVRGESLATSILTADGRRSMHRRAWTPTGDLGVVLDDEVFIAGRTKEIIKVSGEIVAPNDIEAMLSDSLGLEPGKLAAFAVENAHDEDEVVILLESLTDTSPDPDLFDKIRILCLREFRVRPAAILAVRKGCIRRTESGKIKRIALRNEYRAGSLPVLSRD